MILLELPGAAHDPLHAELRCVTENVLREAAGESFEGQAAVAAVTLARRDDPRWPAKLCGVVYQKRAFSWTLLKDKRAPAEAEWTRAKLAVVAAMAGWQPCPGARWYHRDDVRPGWAKKVRPACRLGRHVFYRDP
jgi:spore germination cell wall hydrolase CwlJ-like protein